MRITIRWRPNKNDVIAYLLIMLVITAFDLGGAIQHEGHCHPKTLTSGDSMHWSDFALGAVYFVVTLPMAASLVAGVVYGHNWGDECEVPA